MGDRLDNDPMIDHVSFLSRTIGGRGSCTDQERKAAEYVRDQLYTYGVKDVQVEPYIGAPSTYRPYILSFGAAFLGSMIAIILGTRLALAAGFILNFLGVWGMLAETDFFNNWTRWMLPKANSQNVTGSIPPSDTTRRRVVLSAHLDTHRTPIFYSSHTWHKIFSLLVSLAFASMAFGTIVFIVAAIANWTWLRWLGILFALIQLFDLALLSQADLTPFSPGANDNASGVSVVLELARRLAQDPLKHTEVHFAFTGCEETASYGIIAYLDAHSSALGKETVYIVLDEVGLGRPKYVNADGLIIKHKTHPHALELLRRVKDSMPGLEAIEAVGVAYCDALPATRRGLIALVVSSANPERSETSDHWHQMSDTIEHVDPSCLEDILIFTQKVLEQVDQES